MSLLSLEKTETLTNVPITIIGNEDSSRYTGYLIINYADKEEKFHFDIFVGVIDEDEPTVLNNSKILSGTNRSKVILFDREKEEEESSVIILEIILILIILVIIAFIIHKFAGYKIHEQQIKRLLDIAHRHLEEKKPHHARKTYEKIQHRYKKAPKKVKKKVFKHSHKLHTKIVEHEKKISAKDISTKRSHKGKQR